MIDLVGIAASEVKAPVIDYRELSPLLAAYAAERAAGESFGDFVVRTGVVKATVAGLDFHA